MRPVLDSEAKAYIRRNRLKIIGSDMAARLGVSKCVVQRYIRENGLTPPPEIIIHFRAVARVGRTSFSKKEDAYIRRNYLKWPVKVLADKMGRSFVGVMGRLSAMGLEIPPEIKKRNIAAGRIQKGAVPPNKGKKMPKKVYEKCKDTMFKNGHIPANAKKRDGVVTVRMDSKTGIQYKYIRSSLGCWKLFHRFKWEKHRGPIPKGMCVAFKDGDSLNCKLSNLELITRKELRLRNSGSAMLSDGWVAQTLARKDKQLRKIILEKRPDLIDLKRQSIILKRTINEQKDNSPNG